MRHQTCLVKRGARKLARAEQTRGGSVTQRSRADTGHGLTGARDLGYIAPIFHANDSASTSGRVAGHDFFGRRIRQRRAVDSQKFKPPGEAGMASVLRSQSRG